MSSDPNIDRARRLIEGAFSRGDYSVIDELVAADCIEHQNGAQGTGPEAVRRIAMGLRTSFPDLRLEVEDTIAGEDTVWLRIHGRGTDTGGVAGRPPSGRQIEVDVMDEVRFCDGHICEHWGVADRLGMLQQVGAVPTPGRRPV